jgi:hypothetical protein
LGVIASWNEGGDQGQVLIGHLPAGKVIVMAVENISESLRQYGRHLAVKLDQLWENVAAALGRCEPAAQRSLLARFTGTMDSFIDEMNASARKALDKGKAKPPMNQSNAEQVGASTKLSPELLKWAQEDISEEEVIAGLREIRQTGGLQLSDFLHELEAAIRP